MFVVADQPPVEHQDPVRLLHHPALGLRDKARVSGVAFDDLDVDAVLLAVVDDALLESLVDQGDLRTASVWAATPSSSAIPAALSCALAGRTATATTRPNTSTARHLLRPGTFFAGSLPVVVAGTPTAA